MDVGRRIESVLDGAVAHAEAPGAPPRLAEAIRYAVFPGGHRIRPRLCVAVALACGDDDPAASDAAAGAIELLHCASLVHDDLPCFDDAATRRRRSRHWGRHVFPRAPPIDRSPDGAARE